MNAREEVLRRVRAARPAPAAGVVPRDYRTADDDDGHDDRLATDGNGRDDRLAMLVDRLLDYRAGVHRCTAGTLAATVAGLLGSRVVVPAGVPEGWLSAYQGMVVRDGEPALVEVAELDEPGLTVLTGCAAAIAQTGTLVLDAGPTQGRRLLTLVPDHHVCVVHAGQVTYGVPAGLARLGDPTRPLTLISGPSATSDIELNRVEGVHGPRRLDVVLVSAPAA
ncbi:MAG TPA: LUD domain-containing protein [Micromonosporaceae bacterium]|nr:LUD domain-containing protein [Micromonosporaceae bacterium]